VKLRHFANNDNQASVRHSQEMTARYTERPKSKGDIMKQFRSTWAAAAIGLLSLVATAAMAEKVTPLMAQDMAGMAGKEGIMLTVEYAPGASSTKHRHNAHVFVYVLSGSVVMQVEGGKAVTLRPGQTYYESPDDIHTVSKNASKTKSAKFVVTVIKDKGVPPVVPVK
jgi:quercetin dioxygenase-like cupin family protein